MGSEPLGHNADLVEGQWDDTLASPSRLVLAGAWQRVHKVTLQLLREHNFRGTKILATTDT